jgi:hypothetical protein
MVLARILETVDEFLWYTTERGMYDTEYDLWQYNFHSKTGRFTHGKQVITNVLEVVGLNLDSGPLRSLIIMIH